MRESPTIAKSPSLEPAQDYGSLRQQGLAYVAQLSGRVWTDFNIHDPGITLLELLCYALTDLGYRTSLPVADLLAAPPGGSPDPKRQALHTAREALTVNPLTVRDYRKLLIDLDGVKNAWLLIEQDGCAGLPLYADCKNSVLRYAPTTPHPVTPQGLYDVRVEFEDDEQMGNLNAGKVLYRFAFSSEPETSTEPEVRHTALIELRLPALSQLDADRAKYDAFRRATSRVTGPVAVEFISGNRGDDEDIADADLTVGLRRMLYATVTLSFLPEPDGTETTLRLEDIPLRVWFRSDAGRRALQLPDLKQAIADASPGGLLPRYHALVKRADAVLRAAHEQLHAHRNLCEDFCAIEAVAVEDIAVCADLDLDPSADIEAVIADAYLRVDRYFSPEVGPRSLTELLARGQPVESIFEGPALEHGFLDDAEVDAADLRSKLYTSDIINLLMDIPGVRAVRNFVMTKYDADGSAVAPSAPWELDVSPKHQPRLYVEASKLLVFKNGLTFLPDASELGDILRGNAARVALPSGEDAEDLPVPAGTYYTLQDYYPIQYQLPLTYGVGHEGLPATVGVARLAQAKQLRGYLAVFEQLLVNYLAQLSSIGECFAVDAGVKQTYFGKFIDDGLLRDVTREIFPGLDEAKLQALLESPEEFLSRRNRFLDHLLARFAESFVDYADMLQRVGEKQTSSERRSYESRQAAQARLIEEKVALLEQLPRLTHDRAKALDYRQPSELCQADVEGNVAGLTARIHHLLGESQTKPRIIVVEHLLLRPRATDDGLLDICVPPDCESTCGQEDPYSFRLTIVLPGEGGLANSSIDWRRFTEQAIRREVPAHLSAKICWVSAEQLESFQSAYCAWLAELRKTPANPALLSTRLAALLTIFKRLRSVYPPASLHDCADGNDENRVFLNQTVITALPKVES